MTTSTLDSLPRLSSSMTTFSYSTWRAPRRISSIIYKGITTSLWNFSILCEALSKATKASAQFFPVIFSYSSSSDISFFSPYFCAYSRSFQNSFVKDLFSYIGLLFILVISCAGLTPCGVAVHFEQERTRRIWQISYPAACT